MNCGKIIAVVLSLLIVGCFVYFNTSEQKIKREKIRIAREVCERDNLTLNKIDYGDRLTWTDKDVFCCEDNKVDITFKSKIYYLEDYTK